VLAGTPALQVPTAGAAAAPDGVADNRIAVASLHFVGDNDSVVPRDAALRVAGQPRIFAAGDIAAGPVPDAKLGYVAGLHAAVVARNVAALAAALADGAPDSAAVHLPRAHKAMAKRSLMITVGPGAAFGQMNGGALPGWIIKAIKGKDLITGKVNGDMGWKKAGEYGGAAAPAVV
jgi:NADH dehydrogenase FAD-containing subunit